MTLNGLNLSSRERSLLVEMTDCGISLHEVFKDICLENPDFSTEMHFEISKDLVLGLIHKGLVVLSEFKFIETSDNIYEISDSYNLNAEEINHHIIDIRNWEETVNKLESGVVYELIPTEAGEDALDILFNIDTASNKSLKSDAASGAA